MNTDEKREFFNEWNDNDIYDSLKWKEKLPKYLYRYRPLGEEEKKNEQEFEALKNGKVWASVVSKFNDLNKFAVKSSFKVAEDDINKLLDEIKYYLKKHQFPLNGYIQANRQEEIVKNIIVNLNLNRDNVIYKKPQIRKMLEGEHKGKPMLSLKDNYMVVCFSEEENSEYMWENYANNYEGFIVKYKFEALIREKFCLLPVIYVDKNERIDVGTDNHKITLIKHKVDPKNENIIYENENEWRRVERNINNKKNGQFLDIELPIDTIICGDNISEQHRKEIERICKDKGIKL